LCCVSSSTSPSWWWMDHTWQKNSAGDTLQSETEWSWRSESGRVNGTETFLSQHLQRLQHTTYTHTVNQRLTRGRTDHFSTQSSQSKMHHVVSCFHKIDLRQTVTCIHSWKGNIFILWLWISPSNSTQCQCQLTDWPSCVFTSPLTHKIAQFGDVFQANEIGLVLKILNLAQQKETHTTIKKKCTTTQNKHKKLKPVLVASYDFRPGNRKGLILFFVLH